VGLTVSLLAPGAVATAQTPESIASSPQSPARQEQEVRPGASSREHDGDIYGYQLMTERERSEFRDRIRAANSEQEREQIRSEHRAQMQARARERGVTLPGLAYGAGPRQGVGPGGGAGKGGK